MRIWLFLAAINGALGVIFGAFAVHGLATRLDPNALSAFTTAARYQMYHALAMGLAASAMHGGARIAARRAALFFLVGIVLFSGSLYLLALTGLHDFALLTPFGGLAFILGWVLLGVGALKLEDAS